MFGFAFARTKAAYQEGIKQKNKKQKNPPSKKGGGSVASASHKPIQATEVSDRDGLLILVIDGAYD